MNLHGGKSRFFLAFARVKTGGKHETSSRWLLLRSRLRCLVAGQDSSYGGNANLLRRTVMENFWFTDDWSAGMFQEFMLYCWTHGTIPIPALAGYWQRNVWKHKPAKVVL